MVWLIMWWDLIRFLLVCEINTLDISKRKILKAFTWMSGWEPIESEGAPLKAMLGKARLVARVIFYGMPPRHAFCLLTNKSNCAAFNSASLPGEKKNLGSSWRYFIPVPTPTLPCACSSLAARVVPTGPRLPYALVALWTAQLALPTPARLHLC